jgi:hypothetical protein
MRILLKVENAHRTSAGELPGLAGDGKIQPAGKLRCNGKANSRALEKNSKARVVAKALKQ